MLRTLKKDKRFGKRRVEELAKFLTNYVTQQLEGDQNDTHELAQWTALAYTNPGRAARKLAEALSSRFNKENMTEVFRLASLVETFAEPLAEFAPMLITYARGIESFARGDQEGGAEEFNKLPIQERQVEIAGVSLQIPDEVPSLRAKPDF